MLTGGTSGVYYPLGVAIGIAALVAVMGISASSRADLNAKIDALAAELPTELGHWNLFGGDK